MSIETRHGPLAGVARGICEITLESADLPRLERFFALSVAPGQLSGVCERLGEQKISYRGPIEHPGGDRSVYLEDPEGNIVEVWDFFEHGDGAREGVRALT